jgi:hypothetical protein
VELVVCGFKGCLGLMKRRGRSLVSIVDLISVIGHYDDPHIVLRWMITYNPGIRACILQENSPEWPFVDADWIAEIVNSIPGAAAENFRRRGGQEWLMAGLGINSPS